MGVISNGTTLLDAGALDSGVATGAMTLIKTITASSSATIQFQDGSSNVVLDDTYKEYVVKIINMHPAVDNHIFEFQVNSAGGSGYNETITSTRFRVIHYEDASGGALSYTVNDDLAQGTDHQHLANGVGNANDESLSGFLHIYNPSNTTFVKHFMAVTQFYEAANAQASSSVYTSGYINTTAAIDEIQFKMASGNIDSGTFKLYGIK